MNNFDLEIKQAKEEVIQAKKRDWINKNIDPKSNFMPTPPDIKVNAWFIAKWETGFVVADYEELLKLPKKKREKILALGGIK